MSLHPANRFGLLILFIILAAATYGFRSVALGCYPPTLNGLGNLLFVCLTLSVAATLPVALH